ncbi:MAG: UDP-N-acetylglucosamine 2-epimerase (non-hydrolyzing) [Bacteroidales bacterium]|jgi:UDP-N-acetylglucosamine 2-epimerase (non-hydrolysing)|nr:UDP-N-acetylglucosamine 2-epimerase (non-hydrolyzing) [Bacteroidales bacterium]
MKIISVVGARPNFMKIAPFIRAIEESNKTGAETIEHLLVHTGQHYDDRMSKNFFKALNIPDANIHLGVGSGSHAEQVGKTMISFEKVLIEQEPDWVVVVGDVNATMACSITAKKQHIKCCHIEAGLRSGDIKMPEEVNRLVTDRLSDLLLTPDTLSIENLKNEGTSDDRIKFVGNIMIDTLEEQRSKAEGLNLEEIIQSNALTKRDSFPQLESDNYAVMTLHRPSNVDTKEILEPIIDFISNEVASEMPLIWTVHPRTRKQLETFGLWNGINANPNILLMHPLGYHEMLRLNMSAKIMLTDSGGLQEECTILGTPCLTLRWNTERPITLREHGGASVLVGNNIERIRKEYNYTKGLARKQERPELWDGKTAKRCLDAILNYPLI